MSKNILVLAPHTDDGEVGCGGAIAKFIEEGRNLYYVALSAAEKSVPAGFPKSELRREVKRATKILGIIPENLRVLNFEVRIFPELRQEILDSLIKLREEIKPNIVFSPSLKDLHQDHRVVAEEALRAFKKTPCTILGYEQPWNYITFDTTAFIVLQKKYIEKKVAALKEYKTQKNRHYLTEEALRALAKTRGTQIGVEYAEAFEIMRWVVE